MATFVNAVGIAQGAREGTITLDRACPWGKGSEVTIKRSIRKGGDRVNVVITAVHGNSFTFAVPQNTHTFTMPDFSTGSVVVKGQ